MFVSWFWKAFDNVWRSAIWFKLHVLHNNIKGEIYDIFFNIYNKNKSRSVYDNEFSPVFNYENDVTQGEHFVSFFIFDILIWFTWFFLKIQVMFKAYPLIYEMFKPKLNVFFKLFAILYADDTVLLAES